jgi:hypothetical protein
MGKSRSHEGDRKGAVALAPSRSSIITRTPDRLEIQRVRHTNAGETLKVADVEGKDAGDAVYLHNGNQVGVVGLLSNDLLKKDNPLPCLEYFDGSRQDTE